MAKPTKVTKKRVSRSLTEGKAFIPATYTTTEQTITADDANIVIRGTGSGREQAIRSIQATGVSVRTIIDDTPTPHNGCRPRKRKRP